VELPTKIFVVVENQRIELALDDFRAQVDSGKVGDKSLIWYKGLSNWMEYAQCRDLREELSALAAAEKEELDKAGATIVDVRAVTPEAVYGKAEAKETLVGFPGMNVASAVAASIDVAEEPKAKAKEERPATAAKGREEEDIFAGADDLFGAKPRSDAEMRGRDAEDALLYGRNETSVLFSLKDVNEVQEDDQSSKDDDGIIDVRAIAESSAGGGDAIDQIIAGWESGIEPQEVAESDPQSLDQVASPLIKQKSNHTLYIMIAVLAVAIIGLIAVIFMMSSSEEAEVEKQVRQEAAAKAAKVAPAPAPKPAPEPVAKPAPKPAAKPAVAPATKPAAAAPTGGEPTLAKPAPAPKPAAAPTPKPAAKPAVAAKPKPKPKPKPAAKPKPKPAKVAVAKPAAKPKPKPAKDADAILKAVDKGGGSSAAAGGAGKLPNKLSLAQKKKTMDSASSKVNSCFARFGNPKGIKALKVKLNVAGSGKVKAATIVTPGVAGSAQGNCVLAILKKVSFDPFKASNDWVRSNYRIE
jgi:hypothetical protein